MPSDSGLVAAIYCRISTAGLGDTTKTDEQERLCREVCARRGWTIGEVFTDHNKSAWVCRFDDQGKLIPGRRPQFDAMLAGIRGDRFGAVVTYWGDRLVRQPRDLEDLLDLQEWRRRLGKPLIFASIVGQYDFANPDHRMMMRWEVARACNESDNISRRKKQGFERMRNEGFAPSAGGQSGRGFGYDTKGRVPVPDEAAVLREAAARVLNGETVLALCRDLTARGVRSTSGQPFTYKTLKRILTRPRVAGLFPDGTPGSWEPILDRATWELVGSVLRSPSRTANPSPTAAARYLLSGIAECGVCGSSLQRSWSRQRGETLKSYGCRQPGCRKVSRSMLLLDEYVITRVLLKLNDPANPVAAAPEPPQLASQFKALDIQQAEAEARFNDPDDPSAAMWANRIMRIKERRAQLRDLAAGDASSRLLASHQGLTRAEWDGLPLATRRALTAACFTVTVKPASKRGPGFRTEDVTLSKPARPEKTG